MAFLTIMAIKTLKRNNMKKVFVLFNLTLLLFFIFIGCSSLNLSKINKPSVISSEISLQNWLKSSSYIDFVENPKEDSIFIQMKEDSEYRLNCRLSTRKKIIDSLQIPLNKLMIVDYFSHGTAGPFEVNYFIYDSSFISYSYSTSRKPREKFSSGKVKDLKEGSSHEKMLYEIYNAFNVNYPNVPKDFKREDDGKTSYSYEVTIPKDNKVNFYKISNSENFIVYKLKGKKLLPL